MAAGIELSSMPAGLLLMVLWLSVLVECQSTDCLINEDCASEKICDNHKCIDPCRSGVCGQNTFCHVSDHIPVCACQTDYDGHPSTGCYPASENEANCNQEKTVSSSNSKGKKFHLFYKTKLGWYQSLAHCNSLGMRLATINSQQEQDNVAALIKQANVTARSKWWLGGADFGQHKDYIWMSTGQPLTYQNFHPGEPSSSVYDNGDEEHCIEIHFPFWNNEWNDSLCENRQYHICEE